MDSFTLFGLDGVWAVGIGLVVYGLGFLAVIDAVMNTRTPQGATAWVFALATLPLVALPLYLVFGRSKFEDYVEALQDFNVRVREGVEGARHGPLAPFLVEPGEDAGEGGAEDAREAGEMRAFGALSTTPFTSGNRVRLLVDGDETFEAIFAGIDAAERYVLAQFYIVHDDRIGTAFKERLIAAAQRGVEVRFLYDSVGSWKLPRRYKRELSEAGVEVCRFTGPRNWLKKLRLNFRNHRKIVVVDGRRAYVGGLNVGDEYLGRDPDIGPWRDTHLDVEGPMVQGLQLSFARDWFYGSREQLDGLVWEPAAAPDGDECGLVLASGPADDLETCGLLYAHAIESAEERIWIATPYFVPDGRVLGALQLAALRGVDVRVLMPRTSDSLLFKYVPYAYLDEVARAGVRTFLYEDGFMHQKVALVDRDFAAIGTANFDNRSFRLNFEVTAVVRDEGFCDDVESMLVRDLGRATEISYEDLEDKSFPFRFAANATRLLAPVL
ncbi:cardiolipin synthase [Rubrivirga sp. S365]|uniref:Cardiolipin synthase n=1 Tax=Rubrivirga litoralis TaxID=3075598 RepID=A0ABU3BSJ2_9BACT|nr:MULTISPECIES: cardiolipin synthase [unclassified Rubrivirga]MDT0632257.1 cardiolipin synthase [Rubrivirga sp. F394]MDT7856285.1 cardiolipin synthase [Rubrivirga sp. S365]